MTGVLAVAAAVVAALAFAAWTYLRREPPVGGRAVLAGLRAAVLVLVALLVWNPRLPRAAAGGGGSAPLVLLDGSLSMAARGADGASPWERALEVARDAAAGGSEVLLFGEEVREAGVSLDAPSPPGDGSSLLSPALERAAALGASEVRVLSDLRLEDPVSVARTLGELELPVRFRDVGGSSRNAGVGEVRVPPIPEPGARVESEVVLHGRGGEPGDSADVSVRLDGRPLATRRVPLPQDGGDRRVTLAWTAPPEPGRHVLRFAAEIPGDGFEPDDERPVEVEVAPDRAGLVLLSLRPDWEPRFLLPVLEQVSGLRARGYLSLAGERWLPMGRGPEREGLVEEERIRERLRAADVLVVHGLRSDAPSWIDDALGRAAGTLVFVADGGGAERIGLEVAGLRTGEWYASPELPSSPMAGDLAGLELGSLPPLTSVLPLLDGDAGRVPLRLQPARSGPAEAALVLREPEGRRSAVALASGFWRWASRDGDPREAYRRLWSGVAGWLLAGERVAEGTGTVEPRVPAVRGRPIAWTVRGLDGDSLRLRIAAGDSAVTDTTVVVASAAPVRTPPLPAGDYGWSARAPGLPDGEAGGRLLVSGHSEELQRPVMDVAAVAGSDPAGEGARREAAGRPLRTHPLPYVLAAVLLCGEWIGRRRQGLR